MAKVFKYEDNIVGINVHQVWTEDIEGHNCDFRSVRKPYEKYEVFIRDAEYNLHKVIFWTEFGECGSGWTTCSYGRCQHHNVKHMGSITHRPKEFVPTNFLDFTQGKNKYELKYREAYKDYDYKDYDYKDDVIKYSYDGNDQYYPCGYITIKLDNFIATKRGFDEPVVWFVTGGELLFGFDLIDERLYRIDNILYNYTVFNVDKVTDLETLKKTIGGKIITINIESDDGDTLVFKGPSNLGKSYLAHKYNYRDVYETDQSQELEIPEYTKTIVLGNKYKHTVNDILQIKPNCKICTFSL